LRALIQSAGLTILKEMDISMPMMGHTLANLARRRNTLPFLLAGASLYPIQWLFERLTRRPSALRVFALKC
jgi:hypothetical protein